MGTRITGRLVTGLGEAEGFTQLDWARAQFIEKLGIDPYPGTVNLEIDDPAEIAKWSKARNVPGIVMESPGAGWCNGRCYKVRLAGDIPGAIVVPEVPDYPVSKLEIIAPVGVRDALGVADGDTVSVELQDG